MGGHKVLTHVDMMVPSTDVNNSEAPAGECGPPWQLVPLRCLPQAATHVPAVHFMRPI